MLRFSMWRWCLLFPLHLTEKARLLPTVFCSCIQIPFSAVGVSGVAVVWHKIPPVPHSEDIKTSLLGIPHVTQPWITLVSFTAASSISSSSQLTEKSLDTGTSLHTTMWFSWVLTVPAPNPHNSSSSILPVLHNLLFWDLLISGSIMRLDPKQIQEELLKWSSEKGMKTLLVTLK